MSMILQCPDLLHLYREARSPQAHEHKAVTFFNHLFQNYIFHDKEWFIDTQIPPSDLDPLRKVDMAVKFFENNSWKPVVLCFAEIKRDNAPPAEIDNVEEQAFHACRSYCEREVAPFVYAMTTTGPLARFFQYHIGDARFHPLQVGDPEADATRHHYVDPATEYGWKYWLGAFKVMKSLPSRVPVGGQTAGAPYLGENISFRPASGEATADQVIPREINLHSPERGSISFDLPSVKPFFMRAGYFRYHDRYFSWDGEQLYNLGQSPPTDVEILFVPEKERHILDSVSNSWR